MHYLKICRGRKIRVNPSNNSVKGNENQMHIIIFPRWPPAAILDFRIQLVSLDNFCSMVPRNFYAKGDLCIMTWSQNAVNMSTKRKIKNNLTQILVVIIIMITITITITIIIIRIRIIYIALHQRKQIHLVLALNKITH